MITTLTAMPDSRLRWWKLLIIGSVLALAGGCSALRVAYGNGPTLAWWQLDGWLDADREQARAAKAALERWFAWHRSTQLVPTAALLGEARAQVMQPITPEALCRFNERLQALAQPAIARALDEAVDLVPLLTEANFKAMEAKGAKELAEDRDELLQADPAERRAEALERARKRFERIYGRLDEPQLAVLRSGLVGLPLEPERWIADRERRQKETVGLLRRLVAERASREQRLAALRGLLEARTTPADPERRARQQRLAEANCELGAKLHNTTSLAQRERARDNLLGWENDLRAVMPPAPGAPGSATAAPST
jgi:Family of unknown function (DUF6279)